jgi:hypothetical protein
MMNGRLFRTVVYLLVVLLTTLASTREALAQQQGVNIPPLTSLIRVLRAKGILTDEDVAQINQASASSEIDQRLMKLLLSKGVISQADYSQIVAAGTLVNTSSADTIAAHVVPALYRVQGSVTAAAPELPSASIVALGVSAKTRPSDQSALAGPAVIPALAPIRPLHVDAPEREGLKTGLKLDSITLQPYGLIKATFVHDSSSPYGNDFPLPGFIGDISGNAAPEFHLKARASRLGANFEWLDPSPNLTVTGKIEFDFEGDFTRVSNRNISSIRSSQPSIRLVYGRVDFKLGEHDNLSMLFGQDWTPFGSSTMPSLVESMVSGGGFGTIWERAPQFRFGWLHEFSGFKLLPEVAVVLPAFGNLPSDVANQLGFGERQGADSGRPEIEGRIVGQFQLDHSQGVAPAQLIASFVDSRRTAIVSPTGVPAAFKADFPQGVTVTSKRDGFSAEAQLPTRFATLLTKFYSGSDLRFFLGGQLLSNFNDTAGLTGTATGPSIDGSSIVVFGTDAAGNPTVAPQRPIRSQGGFANLGFPLSRLFGADPSGRNNGWSLYFHYGMDFAKARDVRRAGGGRHRSDLYGAALYYKLNRWVSFAFEESLWETVSIPLTSTGNFPLFQGVPTRTWRDLRSEGGPIFTF